MTAERERTHYEECWRDPSHHECAVAKVERLREVLREVGVSGPYARVQYARPKRQCLACGSSALDRWYAEPAEPIQHKPDCKIASALSEETTDAGE